MGGRQCRQARSRALRAVGQSRRPNLISERPDPHLHVAGFTASFCGPRSSIPALLLMVRRLDDLLKPCQVHGLQIHKGAEHGYAPDRDIFDKKARPGLGAHIRDVPSSDTAYAR
jgi:hypothetical protein